MIVKRTERGWAGHFIAGRYCLFRRNTLLEYNDKKWIVSTVGNYCPGFQNEPDTVGLDRWYETMVFEAEMQNGYIDIVVEKTIETDNDWGIWGETWQQVMETYKTPDNAANDMHERIVNEMIAKILVDDCNLCHDMDWHLEHKRLGFADPIADVYEALLNEEAQLSEEDATFEEKAQQTDYISRQAAIEAIQNTKNGGSALRKVMFVKELEELPSAPVTEVIRCKDCKHFATINEPYNETFCRLCFMNKSEMGYCDKAERRADAIN